jgi:hypothetical protein
MFAALVRPGLRPSAVAAIPSSVELYIDCPLPDYRIPPSAEEDGIARCRKRLIQQTSLNIPFGHARPIQ